MQRHPSNANMPVGGYQHATAAAYQAQQQIARQQEQQMKYNPPAAPVVFTLPENVTSQIPEETAERFLRDAQGQLLWFAVPPLDNGCGGGGGGGFFGTGGSGGTGGGYGGGFKAPGGGNGGGGGGEVGHSVQYLARRRELEVRRELRERARRSEMDEAKRKREQWQEDEKRDAKRVLVRALGLMADGAALAKV